MYRTNTDIARRVYRSLKTPSDDDPRTDPILAFHFRDKNDYIMLRCNKTPEVSIKGKDQTAGEVKFFAYSDFKDYTDDEILFRLKDEIALIELYGKGAIEPRTFNSWGEFTTWLDTLHSLGLDPRARRGRRPGVSTAYSTLAAAETVPGRGPIT